MPPSHTEYKFADLFEFYIEGVMLLVVAVLGILGNIFFILLFSCRRKRLNTFHSLMVSLAYFDSLYLGCSGRKLGSDHVKTFLFLIPNS